VPAEITKVGTASIPKHRPKTLPEHTIGTAKNFRVPRVTPTKSFCRTSRFHDVVKLSADVLDANAPSNADDLKACSTTVLKFSSARGRHTRPESPPTVSEKRAGKSERCCWMFGQGSRMVAF
jgi:hypothetical protein